MPNTMNTKLLRYVPKKFHIAISDIFKDSDGYWIFLKDGWLDSVNQCHVIHTDTIAELKEEIRLIEKEKKR